HKTVYSGSGVVWARWVKADHSFSGSAGVRCLRRTMRRTAYPSAIGITAPSAAIARMSFAVSAYEPATTRTRQYGAVPSSVYQRKRPTGISAIPAEVPTVSVIRGRDRE